MQGKVVVVTGANSGIGKETARALAAQGATVIMGCRNLEKAEAARAELAADTGSEHLHIMQVDVSSLPSVAAFGQAFGQRFDRLDVLVNNAGVLLPRRETNDAGLEMMFAVNHVGYFAVAHALREQLWQTPAARVVNVSSMGHLGGRLVLDDLNWERHAWALGWAQYCNTKLMNIQFSNELARRWADKGVVSNALHPGVVRSGFGRDQKGFIASMVGLSGAFMISPASGATASIFLASAPEAADWTGDYVVKRKKKTPSKAARDEAAARALWERTEALVNA